MACADVDIRSMTVKDYDEIMALWQATEGIGLDRHTDTREGITAYLARNPDLSLVARQDRKMVGTVMCGRDGRRGYLHHLAVIPSHRQQGIGRALVERCLGQLGLLGIQKCNIFLYADNDEGEAFWHRNGWLQRSDLKVLQRTTPQSAE
jgi:putative acetyltransferase